MSSIPRNKFQDFIDDQLFVDWVKNPTDESDKYWKEYISQRPSEKEYFKQAKYILSKIRQERKSPNDGDAQKVWSNIQVRLMSTSINAGYIYRWLVAASVILVLGIGSGILFQIIENRKASIDYKSIALDKSTANEVKLILSDNSEKRFATKDPSIKYSQAGEIRVDSMIVSDQSSALGEDDKVVFNQLIVPKGKRSSLTFSDGTKLYLNSGSQVIYPVTFNKQLREIYIRGEGYLEVAHNADCPFVVKTDHMDVRVLGTEFNIKAYPDETSSSVVLVKGSVQAIVKSQKIMMKENELLTFDNSTQKRSLEKTRVLEYTSWKDGWMYCNNESIGSIAKKLSRYYDVDIQLKDEKVRDLKTTGKLDLKSEYTEVLDVISFTAPIKYEVADGKVMISTK